ncbi:MAG TPA: hypothetical protein VJ720_15515 [Chitinophaga sp.]|nr:hypothetical protein [Chitinophaga sp.]
MFYKIALVMHITGIAMLAGTTFIDFILSRQVLKSIPGHISRGITINGLLHRLQRITGVGMLVVIASGIIMMAYLHQVWGKQLWFQVKMGILLLIIINGLVIRRRMGGRLDILLTKSSQDFSVLKRNMSIMYLLQMLFFLTVFVLSVFKFN